MSDKQDETEATATAATKPAAPAVVHIKSLQQLFTNDHADDGVRVDIFTPTGERTDAHLRVCFVESKAYRQANVGIMRKHSEANKDDASEDLKAARDLDLACAFVIGWNLPVEFTPDNVRLLLSKNTGLRDRVVNHGVQRELFFALPPYSSLTGPDTSSG